MDGSRLSCEFFGIRLFFYMGDSAGVNSLYFASETLQPTVCPPRFRMKVRGSTSEIAWKGDMLTREGNGHTHDSQCVGVNTRFKSAMEN